MIPLPHLDPYDADLDLASPNHGPRRADAIGLIVLHATADQGSERGAESWMRNPQAQVSAHLHIRRDGTIVRLVDDRRRAWHAGRASWPGVSDVNDESLGWEIANRNDGKEAYTDEQYRAVADLLQHYLPQGIHRPNVVGHFQVSPGRKTDPRGWDWGRTWRLVDEVTEPEEPDVELADTFEDRRNPIPHPGKVHPLRKPVAEVAKPGESTREFLLRTGAAITQPVFRAIWNMLVRKIEERAAQEVDEALDRVLGK